MESSCHEGVIIRYIAEDQEFCTAERIVVAGCLCFLKDDLSHQFDRIHIYASFGGANVHRAAQPFRLCKCRGMDRISISSTGIIPLETRAEYPPRKLTPVSSAARSSVFAIVTKSSGVLQTLTPTRTRGVTEIHLLAIGMPRTPVQCPCRLPPDLLQPG